jgi:uncharacterized membrane protein/alpha-beta hydrolase superfamily lysophospholipase
MKPKILSLLQFVIGWPLSLIAVFFIGKIILSAVHVIQQQITTINFVLLFLSLISFLLYFGIRSFFWKDVLRLKGYRLSFKESAFLWELSEVKRFIPGNIWSLLGKVTHFSHKGIDKRIIVESILVEVKFFILSCLLLSLLSLNFIIYGILPSSSYSFLFAGFIVCFFLAIIGVSICYQTFFLKKTERVYKTLSFLFPPFSFIENSRLFFIMGSAVCCFGFGTYFGIASFTYLYLPHLLTFIGFFIFSFLTGYLSFVMPMGLGIREAIMAIGLTKYIFSFPLASFLAIIARVIFIISEVIYLSFSFFWYKTKSKAVSYLECVFTKYRYEILLIICVFLFILYFTFATFLRYQNFYTGRFDLGNMDQTVWNTIHGRVFQITDPNGTNIISRLSFHADFLLIFLAPFYFLWQDPRMLLLLQVCIIACGSICIFLLAKNILDNKRIAFFFALFFLLNPSVCYAVLYDFHAVTLATTFFLAAFYFLLKKRYFFYTIFLFLAGLSKEEVWIVVAFLGLFTAFSEKKKIVGYTIFITSFMIFVTIFFYLIPHIRGSNHFALSYYADFGTTPVGILKTMILSPQKTLSVLFTSSRILYIIELLLPLGFLPSFTPVYLIFLLPDLFINLLSNSEQFHQIYYQYTSVITPFLFIAAIYSFQKLQKKLPSLTVYLLFTSFLSAYLFGSLPGSIYPSVAMFNNPQPYVTIIDNFLRDIPDHYSIAATNNIGSHLSHREKIFTVPVGIDQADIVIFLLNDMFAQPSLAYQKDMANHMKKDKNYIEIFKIGDFVVFEKRNLYAQEEPDTTKITLFPVSIPTLQERDFVGGMIDKEKKVEETKTFTSYNVSYPSDGLKLFALMNIPRTKNANKKFPVVIINHGLIAPTNYNTEKSYKVITDFFATKGFLVIKPDYRGNGNSEEDKNISQLLSYPIDVLNLISSLPTIPEADTTHVFLWGHSIGGATTLTTIEAIDQNPNSIIHVTAASIWAPVIDPYRAYTHFSFIFSSNNVPYKKAVDFLGSPGKNFPLWESVSPIVYADDIKTPIQITHGTNDEIIPYQWSIELYDDLISLNKKANLVIYPGDDHVLSKHIKDALEKNYQFFKSFL